MTAGQTSDYIVAVVLFDELPEAQWLVADRGYDGDRPPTTKRSVRPSIVVRPAPFHRRSDAMRSAFKYVALNVAVLRGAC